MCKIKSLFLILPFIVFGSSAFHVAEASIAYIKDSVGIPIKNAPDGKTIAYLANGDQLDVIEKSGNYSKIQLSSGKFAWIENQFLQAEPSLKQRIPYLESQVSLLTEQLDDLNNNQDEAVVRLKSSVVTLTAENENLTTENQRLSKLTAEQATQIETLTEASDTQRQDIFLKWFTRGALVAGAAFLIGLILPLFLRRKKPASW